MEPLAHSARPKLGIQSQLYREHVIAVTDRATANAREAAGYCPRDADRLIQSVRLAAEFHDFGKLDEANQTVLTSDWVKEALPVNHVDAGVAQIFNLGKQNVLAAGLVYAHHIGLPDFQDQRNNRPGCVLRDTSFLPSGQSIRERTNQNLKDYLELHQSAAQPLEDRSGRSASDKPEPMPPLLFRIALSCLVDADHQDTARHYGQAMVSHGPSLRPADRLKLLDAYVRHLAMAKPDERTRIREKVYEACRNASVSPSMYACDSPVGSGKTTAVMAHLLRAASEKKLRRVFVILPFTNIIEQSVDVYRRALVGIGERGEDVVAAHHHRAEFDSVESRQFAFLWRAPVVVTTAVQFFETLAGNHPMTLRKLHELPGSVVFIDEAHAALPPHLWPQAWRWLRELESRWGCHFVLGSGSLSRFWELEEFSPQPTRLPDLVSVDVRGTASAYERARVQYVQRSTPETLNDLIEWLPELPGPGLLIVNTVQSAAVLAREIAQRMGRKSVEHLSTSLCPRDRKATLDQVVHRLDDDSDKNWTLVATSCVEAGLDLSFRTGLRERCSLNSLIQVGGRVNRRGEFPAAAVWDFEIRHDARLPAHPAFDASARILGELFKTNQVSPEFSTEAMQREIRQAGMKSICHELLTAEQYLQFPSVADKFKVIDSSTVTVIVDEELIRTLESGALVDFNDIQRLSVQIWRYRELEYALRSITRFPDLSAWTLEYDKFLGYMAGVLQVLDHKQHGSIV